MKLPTSAKMRTLDNSAIKNYNIPGIVLMENAGLGTVRMMVEHCGPCSNTFAAIFVGPGNNGGDGLVIGRHLYQRGCQPIFFFLVDPANLKGDAAINLKITQRIGLTFHVIDNVNRVKTVPDLLKDYESHSGSCYAIVDSIFGIGLTRKVENHFSHLIDIINKRDFAGRAPVVSVDIPSGLDSDTGNPLGSCVRADYTATYCCAKPGHFIQQGPELSGKLKIIDIGIPRVVIEKENIQTELITKNGFKKMTGVIARKTNSHKGTYGHLIVIGGSTGKTGAAILASKGAVRAGSGLVSLLAPRNLNTIYEISLVEAMTIPLKSSGDFFQLDDIDLILKNLKGKQAAILGPGIGMDESTRKLVLRLYHEAKCPLILDADALNLLALSLKDIRTPAGSRIFTPHPGELARLTGKSTETVQKNRLKAGKLAYELFRNPIHDIILVLKGAQTLIFSADSHTAINPTGNPGMATGGMGDVLSGIIGALICQGMSSLDAAVSGVFLHGSAGDDLCLLTGTGYTATELTDRIPITMKNLLSS